MNDFIIKKKKKLKNEFLSIEGVTLVENKVLSRTYGKRFFSGLFAIAQFVKSSLIDEFGFGKLLGSEWRK